MAAGIYVKDSGTWKLPKSIWVKSGGTWRVCQNVYVNRYGAWQEMIRSVTLTSSKNNFNLWNYVGNPTQPLSLIFNISSGVEIYSSGNTGGYRTTAFTVGNFPSGSTVVINNNGYISGGGGDRGGADSQGAYVSGGPGGNGGYGLVKGSNNNFDCTLVNTGTIAGGGGGGGGGGAYTASNGGAPGAYGGQGAGITGFSKTQGEAGQAAQSGTLLIIGGADITVYGGKGGNGGSNSQDGTSGANSTQAGGAGGKGRAAILRSGIDIAVSGNIDGSIV